jgi:hypothetical protein
MRVPDTLKILGKTWKVIREEYLASDGERYGEVRWMSQGIYLDNRMTGEHEEDTFLHELVHILCINCGIDMEEEEVRRFASNLHQLLHDNRLKFFDEHETGPGVNQIPDPKGEPWVMKAPEYARHDCSVKEEDKPRYHGNGNRRSYRDLVNIWPPDLINYPEIRKTGERLMGGDAV